MVEGTTENGASVSWNVGIRSSNIYDGPVTLTFVAYDKAGNSSIKRYPCSVSNNGPRFAGFSYGTDDNGNGVIDSGELIDERSHIYASENREGLDKNGNKVTSITRKNSSDIHAVAQLLDGESDRITVKGLFKVVPEVVGGNRGLGYSYTYLGTDETTHTTAKQRLSELGASGLRDSEDLSITITVRDFIENEIKEGDQWFRFDIYDNTVANYGE